MIEIVCFVQTTLFLLKSLISFILWCKYLYETFIWLLFIYLKSKGHTCYSLFSFNSRSTRGGSRGNSFKIKAHGTIGNGDVNQLTNVAGTRKTEDFDIKDIQQKKQQAEQKRYTQYVLRSEETRLKSQKIVSCKMTEC